MFNKYPMWFLWPQIWETLIYRIPEPRFICSSPSCMGEPMRIQLTLHSWPSNLLEENRKVREMQFALEYRSWVTDPHTPETSFKAEESFGEMDVASLPSEAMMFWFLVLCLKVYVQPRPKTVGLWRRLRFYFGGWLQRGPRQHFPGTTPQLFWYATKTFLEIIFFLMLPQRICDIQPLSFILSYYELNWVPPKIHMLKPAEYDCIWR